MVEGFGFLVGGLVERVLVSGRPSRGLNLPAQLSLEAEPSKFLLALGSHVSGSHQVASECPDKEW